MKPTRTPMEVVPLVAPLIFGSVGFTQEENFYSRELNFREYVEREAK